MLDILGFKELVAANEPEEVCAVVEDFVNPKTSGSGWLEGELRAFQFIVAEAARMQASAEVPPRTLAKYANTVSFIRTSLGEELFALASKLAGRLGPKLSKG